MNKQAVVRVVDVLDDLYGLPVTSGGVGVHLVKNDVNN
jgi:hypothetical protein